MRVYTVHERPVALGQDREIVLVKEGFCWPASLAPILWAPYHRLWLGLIVYLAAAVGLGALAGATGLDEATGTTVAFGFSVLVGFEANDWRRRSLARRGYRLKGVAVGEDLDAAERRLFTAKPAERAAPPAPALSQPAPASPPPEPTP